MNLRRCTRRRFLSATLGLAGLSAARFPLTEALSQGLKVAGTCGQSGWMDGGRSSVEGYAIQRSYLPGERVILCLSSTSRSRATLIIQRLGADDQSLRTASILV